MTLDSINAGLYLLKSTHCGSTKRRYNDQQDQNAEALNVDTGEMIVLSKASVPIDAPPGAKPGW